MYVLFYLLSKTVKAKTKSNSTSVLFNYKKAE